MMQSSGVTEILPFVNLTCFNITITFPQSVSKSTLTIKEGAGWRALITHAPTVTEEEDM